MKNKQLNIVLLLLAIFFTAGITSFAQRGNRMAGANSCCLNIRGLTEKQKTEINSLTQQHRKEMAEMRDSWRQSASYIGREAHLAAVSQKVAAHRETIQQLLTNKQKSAFENLQGKRGEIPGVSPAGKMGRGPMCHGFYCQGGRFGKRWGNTSNL